MQIGFIDLINCERALCLRNVKTIGSPKLSPLHSHELEVLKSEIL